MATITMEQLQEKVERVQKNAPQVVKASMNKGANILVKEMRRRYVLAGLKQRSGDLFRSIKLISNKLRGTKITTAAGVSVTKGHSQVYKAVAHELGLTVNHPGGQPFFFVDGKLFFASRRNPRAAKMPKTKPSTIQIPRRQFVAPTKRAKLPEVRQIILNDLLAEYKKHG